MRHLALALLIVSSPCFAQSTPESAPQWETSRRDAFVKTDDACGASRYANLVGQYYALTRAALPPGTVIHGPASKGVIAADHRLQSSVASITLEYRAQRLNVVLDSTSRILSIACH